MQNCKVCGSPNIEIGGWWRGDLWIKCNACQRAFVPDSILPLADFEAMTEAIMAEVERVKALTEAAEPI